MKIIDVKNLGTGKVFQWTREYLFEFLTKSRNAPLYTPTVMAAFQHLDRRDFIPNEIKDKAYEDIELEIGHNEHFTRPSTLAQVAELIKPKAGGSYLDIGTGTGYFAMILGFVAGSSGKVVTIERIQWLWELARVNSTKYKDINNVTFLYRNGIEGLPQQAPYDGIHISFAIEEPSDTLKMQLNPNGGIMVYPTTDNEIKVIERMGDDYTEEIIPGFVFSEGKAGIA
ncbi:class I SAM-dependent methyltransferase [Candidatus Dojkabacteria bacterium]|uniref:Protein-L-isoaspartate O-methyltransferase n=1 Tax=Candidatus Dojkabacteria bacterium TaxID=2099670 RepID=A0A955LAJ8_9BACT|nr:class I SAM-dependent methyltransferase [Candidatus Dojkabacteria bacterium]